MATMDKKFVDEMIAGDGYHPSCGGPAPDNPAATRIVEYTNAWGAKAYGVTFETDRDQDKYLRESEYVREPRIYWERATAP